MKDIAFIIQARVGSTRLPKKMVMPFYNDLTIPQVIVEKLRNSFPESKIFLATTVNPIDDQLVDLFEGEGVVVYRGSEDNVLQRFVEIGEKYQLKNIVRVCADNPFLDMELLAELIDNWSSDNDYLGHRINDKPCMKTDFGFFAEITTFETLKRTANLTKEPLYIEHVTNYIYQNPDIFNVNWVDAPALISENESIRLTVDTEKDFELARVTYSSLKKQNIKFGYKEIIKFVGNQKALINKMLEESKSNQK